MYLVTGAAGFIGSNLVEALEREGASGIAVCDTPSDDGKWRNLAKRNLGPIVESGQLLEFLGSSAGDIETIFHMGAISSTTETDLELLDAVNVRLPTELWDWCAKQGVPFIYASSAATYGDGAAGFDDDWSLAALAELKPLNGYGRSKNKFDQKVAAWVAEGAPTPPHWAGLKFFNVYGPNEYHKGGQRSVVPQIHEQVKASGVARLFKSHNPDYPDGGQLRDFIWVGDCVDVMLWLARNPDVNGIFNCGTGKARTFIDLAKAVFAALGKEPNIEFIPTPENIRDKYQYFTEASMDRLLSAGYDAGFTSLEDGVARYVQEFLAKDDPFL
ncbi:MAG: ADP-glyceromanno-heptose 6-epimerase [Rhodospirillales bacterium]|nr:ADP-glyceromanno-heptose 6-epimerase [Rhodospirillales bacterium]